jgi:hypothetical protein
MRNCPYEAPDKTLPIKHCSVRIRTRLFATYNKLQLNYFKKLQNYFGKSIFTSYFCNPVEGMAP